MKKIIIFIVVFSLTLFILTLCSTHRVYVEIETNQSQNIQITNWGKQFVYIKSQGNGSVTFYHRFHLFNDNINIQLPPDETIEITSMTAAGKTYSASEI